MRKWVAAGVLLLALGLGAWLVRAERTSPACSGCCTGPHDCPTPACCKGK